MTKINDTLDKLERYDETCDYITIEELRTILEKQQKDIKELERYRQNLIKKFEKKIKLVEKCYQDLIKPYYNEKLDILDVSFMSKKEFEEFDNKCNCLLVQKYCYEEVLKS